MTLVSTVALWTLLSGCTQSEPMDAGPADAATAGSDAATFDLSSSCLPMSCATVEGVVKRKSGVLPQHGGKGPLFLSIMDGDPVFGGSPRLIAVQMIADVDLNPDNTMIPYRLTNVPIRKEAYSLMAFLDDNHTVTAQSSAPDKGDLISLDGLAAPKVTVDRVGTITADIVLTNYLPF